MSIQAEQATERSLDKLVGQPTKIMLQGKEYTLTPITPRDLAGIEEEVRAKSLRIFYKAISGSGLSPREISKKEEALMYLPLPPNAINSALSSASGALYMVQRSLEKAHPGIVLDDLNISDDEILEATRKVDSISFPKPQEEEGGEEQQTGAK